MQTVFVSEFRPDPARSGPWLAALWQGPAPTGVVLRGWYYLDTQPRSMLIVWEAADADARSAFEARFALGGELTTRSSLDATPGLAAALARDLDAFGAFMVGQGTPADEVERAVDLRRRGRDAPTLDAALAAGQAWADEQAAGRP